MFYDLSAIERRLKEDQATFLLDNVLFEQIERECNVRLEYNDDVMSMESLLQVLKYLSSTNQAAWVWHAELKKKIDASKRKYSTSHRIEVAYSQQYKCKQCKYLLPPTFQIDHIVELADGGKDEFTNLQALCPNCHAEKTRLYALKKNKLFGKHFQEKYDAFNRFHYNKKSKYFHDTR
jgi:5-methylcytosine-specific restriction endonuclease McrA